MSASAQAAVAINPALAVHKKWTSIYPLYVDKSKSVADGRLVPIQYAIEKPSVHDIATACKQMGLECEIEPYKRHPRDQYNDSGVPTGRVKVNFFVRDEQTKKKKPIKEVEQAPFKPAPAPTPAASSDAAQPAATPAQQPQQPQQKQYITKKRHLIVKVAHLMASIGGNSSKSSKELKKEEKAKAKDDKKKEKKQKEIKIKGLKK